MKRYLGIGAAWLGATVVSVLIASAAVAGIRDRVVETPVAIGLPTSTTTTTTVVESTSGAAPSTTAAPSRTTTTSPTVTTAPPIETTSTTVTAPTETTTTTTPPTTTTLPPTTTTTAPPATTTTTPVSYSTYDLTGGTVVLAFGNGQVNLVSATPRAGFSVDAEHTGPAEVEVKFVSSDHKSKLEARIDSGELRVETEEEPRDEDDD